MGGRRLGSVVVVGTTYPVVQKDLGEDEGSYEALDREISVHEKLAVHARPQVIAHEQGHAVWHELGLSQALAETTGISQAVIDRIEEAIMCTFVPAYTDTLERNGFMRAPAWTKRKPKGTR